MNQVKRNLVLILFWKYPMVWASTVVLCLSRIIDNHVAVVTKQGMNKEQIYKLANQFVQCDPSDIDEMIKQRNKQRLKRLLEDYHALGEPYKVMRYSQVKVKSGRSPADVPYGVVLKIVIDQAIKKLAKHDWELAAILEMRYIDKAEIQEIKTTFGVSRRTIFNRLNKAMEKIMYIVE